MFFYHGRRIDKRLAAAGRLSLSVFRNLLGINLFPTFVENINIMADWLSYNKEKGVGGSEVEVTAALNPTTEERKHNIEIKRGQDIATVAVTQAGATVVIPPFDYLIINYIWESSAGEDFDAATCFINTGIAGLDKKFIGWSQAGTSDTFVNKFLVHGGDELKSGRESALVRMDVLTSDAYFDSLPDLVYIDNYGNWYKYMGTGAMSVQYIAVKGGDVARDGYGFQVINGGVVVYDGIANTSVKTMGTTNFKDPNNFYTYLGRIIYDKNERGCSIVLGA